MRSTARAACAALSLVFLGACAAPRPSLASPPLRSASLESVSLQALPPTRTWEFGISGLLGGREFFDETYRELDTHAVFGVEFDARPKRLPIGFELGLLATGTTEEDAAGSFVDLEGSSSELYFGPRVTFAFDENDDIFRLYAGTGLSLLYAELERWTGTRRISDDDGSLAGYVHGGFYFQLAEGFRLGLDVRYIYASDLTLFGEDADAESLQVAVLFGGGW